MPKHKKIPHRRNVEVSPKIPYSAQVRQLRGALEEMKRQTGKIRRMLWIAVHKAGGRIEMEDKDYTDAMEMPNEDSIVVLKRDAETGKLTLVFTDEKGELLKESKRGVIITDAR
jgi:hypothetical protein